MFANEITLSESDTSEQVVIDKLSTTCNSKQTKTFCDEQDLIMNAGKTQLILMKAPLKRIPSDLVLKLDGSDILPSPTV